MSARCDTTEAWAALQGHFEAHGRDLDLREGPRHDGAPGLDGGGDGGHHHR